MAKFIYEKTYASLPATSRGQFIVINGDPKGKNFLYCNGSQVFIRNLRDTSICDIYTEHIKDTTVAKYSPSGFYIASGDKEGKVRVWDTINEEHILKKEHPVISGAIKDIDWTLDNSKICAVGEGREMFGRVFTFDSGNSVGEIMGHSNSINNCSFKPTRPMKLVTSSEDFASVFYDGPPFKFKCSKLEHTNFVNCARFSSDGEVYVTGGADGKLFMYDGKSSDLIGELGEPKAHKGGIYAICFNEDGKKLLSVSGDKTAKIWNIESKALETEFVIGTQVSDMQVGCLWQQEIIMTVSLSGFLNYLDPANPSSPAKIVKGHSKPIMSMTSSDDGTTLYTAGSDGLMLRWNAATSECEDFKGKGHTNQVNGIIMEKDSLISVGMDDTIRYASLSTLEHGESFKLDSQPKAVDSKNGISVIACTNHIIVMENPGRKLSTLAINFEALSVSIHPNGTEVAIGTKSTLIIFSLDSGTLTESKKIPAVADVCATDYSPDGKWLIASFGKRVNMFDTNTWEEQTQGWGEQHTAKVTCLKFSPNSQRFASGSVDAHMILWENGKFLGSKPNVKAHPKSCVNQVAWLGNDRIATAGQDSNIKLWSISG